MPSCDRAGGYRAPKSRTSLNEYWWFCLEHVREYNAGWDFYRGMSPGQIEAQLRSDTSWQRPTWPLGRLGGSAAWSEEAIHDPLGVLSGQHGRRPASPPPSTAPGELRAPLDTLGLGWPVSLEDVKARWKALAKRHHPDANGGDRGAEERLKVINLAYAAVRAHLAEQPAARRQAAPAG